MKVSNGDRIIKKKLLDKLDSNQIRFVERWIDKPIIEMQVACKDIQEGRSKMTVSEGLVVRMLLKKMQSGK